MQLKNIALLALLFLSTLPVLSQENESKLNIFLNCTFCDESYIKQNLEYAEFVRDQKFADVYLFFSRQQNGSGGQVYKIDIVGQNDYKGFQNKITFSTNSDHTKDEVRGLMLRRIRLGLVRFWIKAGLQDEISITIKKSKKTNVIEEVDPWNKWIFSIGANGNFKGQETYTNQNLKFNVSARRVTEKNKFYFRVKYGNNKSIYEFDNGPDIVYNNASKDITLYSVFSLNNHWSAGVFSYFGGSDYTNKVLYAQVSPAIEYNFFDYKDSFQKQLTIVYKVGGDFTNYIEKTVFGKDQEFLWRHSLSLEGSVRQTWGNVNGSIRYDSYLHDTALNQFSFNAQARVRVFKGFSFNMGGRYNITNNQINLPAGNLTVEEILLQQQQIKSGFNYSFDFGFSYTFGSMFNTVVNPRFD
ncbi:hypothetical protein GCM10011416_17130 [Polaribacter pacificus]|uniref:Outer membrane protein beta-barrel family protein n=1 Tax=Polaribacter pacificus TaxID=1775173 RepID=A0A917HZD0_9FLAO|nr:hypothetical protein [Polaribacter pacificus]GGG99387.1 hypothetical protein GCM10011416_17130 [Polaribacter pacificus]